MKQVVLLSLFLVFLLTGCHPVGGSIRVSSGYPYSEPMPPVHAPAHGRRHLYRYHYYPDADFYFDISRRMYFYLDSRGAWTASVTLPLHFHAGLNSGYIEIDMGEERPYLKHKYHREQYRAHKYKKMYKEERRENREQRKDYKRQYNNHPGKNDSYRNERDDEHKKSRRKNDDKEERKGKRKDDDDRSYRGRKYD
ncbi:MAG: hypothetical protein OEW97_04215 [Gammaproteobacteria bacterium]|nr:hypothetical protein [Gammaproteobacteria bacterium]